MKRIFFIVLILAAAFSLNAYAALDTTSLLDLKNKIFEESQAIRPLLTESGSKDIILLNSMCDVGIMTISQLDAYFYMAGIFNAVKDSPGSATAVDYLIKWLSEVKKGSDTNLKVLASITTPVEAGTTKHIQILSNYYTDLSKQLDVEINKVVLLKKALKQQ